MPALFDDMSEHADPVKTYALVFLGLLALTGITTRVAYVDLGHFSVVVALICEVPVPTPVARPVVVMVATAVVAEAQVTDDVRFWVLASE